MPQTTPLISVIMPVLNGAETIGIALDSVRKQDYDQNKIEILVIDGGSGDDTIKIATEFGCKVLTNKEKFPEPGRVVGLNKAKGKYCVFMDRDEELILKSSFTKRVELFRRYPQVKNITCAGLQTPLGYNLLTEYINSYGDPFSNYIYDLDGADYAASLRKRYKVATETNDLLLIGFTHADLLPVVDGGTHMFDREYYLKVDGSALTSPAGIPAISSSMISHSRHLGIIKGDYVKHYSTATIKGYLKKLDYRVACNLYYPKQGAGYVNRSVYMPKTITLKKYLYPVWVVSLIPIFVRSVKMCVQKKNLYFLINVFFGYYTLAVVTRNYLHSWLGKREKAGRYDFR